MTEPGDGPSLSTLLRELPGRLGGETASVGELIDQLSPKSQPLIMLILAFPNLVPIPAPGLSAVLGLPLAVVTAQLALGYDTPRLPQVIARRRISLARLTRACAWAAPHAARLEARIKPRLTFLLAPPSHRILGVIAAFLSLVLMLPVPFGNAMPALAICLIALGLLRGDGLTALLGLVTAALGLAVIVLFAGALAALAAQLLRL